ncbi:unnamed protein product [Trichobilharzia regenti]|nr:unnamed protein product [Trichobilharzia regenti]
MKQVNEKTGLLNYSNFSTHLYTDAISEASQLAFIEHRKYPSCLINPPKAQVVEIEEEAANVITTQGVVNSFELVKRKYSNHKTYTKFISKQKRFFFKVTFSKKLIFVWLTYVDYFVVVRG